jgi:hypothetical protein
MAKYNLKEQFEIERFRRRTEQLIKKGALTDLTEVTKRSLNQNSYLHLILSYFALELGYSLWYVKVKLFKCTWNKDIFIIEKVSPKTGEQFTDIRSTRDLSKEEMAKAIDTFIEKAALEANIRLPQPSDLMYEDEIRKINLEVSRNEKYL